MPALVKTKSKGCPYCRNKRVLIGFNDLATWCKDKNRTQILDDWDYNKNAISPTQVTWGSNRKVWFKCHICGYEWKTTINSRSSANTDCRMCSRRISSSFPEQCVYYYFSKCFSDVINGDTAALKGLELDIYVPSMKFAVEYDGGTWHKDTKRDLLKDQRCEENDIILYRIRESDCESLITRSSVSFEYRYGDWDSLSEIIKSILNDLNVFDVDIDVSRDEYKIKEQYYLKSLDNSLQKLYPQIAAEWHPTKNGNITPDVIIAETHDEYYWLCPSCGHTYKAMVKNRVRMHSGCPKCGKAKASKEMMDYEFEIRRRINELHRQRREESYTGSRTDEVRDDLGRELEEHRQDVGSAVKSDGQAWNVTEQNTHSRADVQFYKSNDGYSYQTRTVLDGRTDRRSKDSEDGIGRTIEENDDRSDLTGWENERAVCYGSGQDQDGNASLFGQTVSPSASSMPSYDIALSGAYLMAGASTLTESPQDKDRDENEIAREKASHDDKKKKQRHDGHGPVMTM